jgi:hypothetical protein
MSNPGRRGFGQGGRRPRRGRGGPGRAPGWGRGAGHRPWSVVDIAEGEVVEEEEETEDFMDRPKADAVEDAAERLKSKSTGTDPTFLPLVHAG